MPGATTNPMLNPEQAWMDYHPNQDINLYRTAIGKGYKYLGADNWDMTGGGAPSSPGMPGQGGGGVTSLATGQSVAGPYSGAAQMAQARSEFDRIMKQGMGQLNEAAALSGGFSGGIPFDKRQQFITDTTNQENAALERIMNDIIGRNQSYTLDQQRLQDARNAALYQGGSLRFEGGGGSTRYSGGQTGGGGQGYNETGGGGPSVLDPKYAGDPTKGIEPMRAPGESSYDFYARLDAYHARVRKGF